jgi:serine/threonine protein phosphatase PrpC
VAAELPESGAAFDFALLSDVGATREGNEDHCGHFLDGPDTAVMVVADGIGGYEGGEIASKMAVDNTIAAYRASPAAWGPAKRLYRALQRANLDIHERALTVPELRRMGTTATAVVIDDGFLYAVHVGDCRLYLMRGVHITQMTRDHTWVGERLRLGMMTAKQARNHPDRSALQRCIGHELIVSIDRVSFPLIQGDRILLCSDGLYGELEDSEIEVLSREGSADSVTQILVNTANARRTRDNLTAAFFRMLGATSHPSPRRWHHKLLGRFKPGR